ncbi:TonB-dependent copper receptor [Thauera aromatica]|nr:TonB-dependent copper receptor [Thauera aromatica]MCK2127859.1 TonB-dependent copper receptor [Thauera aromatica]
MQKTFQRLPLAVAISLALPALAVAQEATLGSVVVTAPLTTAPLTITTDPKAPRQPLPAHDGADLLKSIPGFSVIRKGGADGDPVFRGLSGSRLNILQDGQDVHGGCGGRMDPPTAYIYPESYDRVTVIKGPQTVLYGGGNSAAVVLFERDMTRMTEPGWAASGSLTFGSWGRNDQVFDATAGNPDFYARIGATRSDMNDYEDGDGKKVHSFYTRWSTNGALGWTPDDNTLLELNFGRSDGEAAYADRAMDGTKFEREHVGLKFEKRNISPLVHKVEVHAYYSYLDHVMDNFSLRSNMGMKMLNNPDRETKGGRFAVTLTPADPLQLMLGADVKADQHTSRSGVNYRTLPRTDDFGFDRYGIFGEATYALDGVRRVIGGLRIDDHEVTNDKTGGAKEGDTLPSGFLRFERDYAGGAGTWYVGLGHAERFPDFWEFMRAAPGTGSLADARSFDTLEPEKNTQLDVGASWTAGNVHASVSGFYSKVDNYMLLRWFTRGTSTAADVRNIDATLYGLETDLTWRFASNWSATGTLAWVHGRNDTDDKALAQQPPLEGRLALEYNDGTFSYGGLLRVVARQDRVDVGSGSIVSNGKDLGPTPGFATLALNAGWRPNKVTLLTAGVDNVFDRTYHEHLSQGSAAIAGYEAATNEIINEPGRTFWLKVQMALD